MTTKPLASERVRAGLTQEEAAARLGCSVKSLCFYENNVRITPSDIANAAADLYGCSTDYIYGRTEERIPKAADERKAG